MKNIALLILMGFMALMGCEEDSASVTDIEGLKGTWVRAGYQDTLMVMVRRHELDEDKYGFRMIAGGRFIERKNSGRCATPPINYKNYEGWWKQLSDSLIDMRVGYWGGMADIKMEIHHLQSDTLKVHMEYENL